MILEPLTGLVVAAALFAIAVLLWVVRGRHIQRMAELERVHRLERAASLGRQGIERMDFSDRSGERRWSLAAAVATFAGVALALISLANANADTQNVGGLADPGRAPGEVEVPVVQRLQPMRAEGTAYRESLVVTCDRRAGRDEPTDYSAARIIDGNMNTGWWAAKGDARGKSVTIHFGNRVHLTSVGIMPGFAKVGPRPSHDCHVAEAFQENQVISEVQYLFDDGSSISQAFEPVKSVQSVAVDVETLSVTIVIVESAVLPGYEDIADNDAVISEAVFEGYPVDPP